MFSILFGLHLAIRAVVDWICGARQHGQQQDDLGHDRSATDRHDGQQQDDLDHDRSATDRHDGQQQDDLDHDRSATDQHDGQQQDDLDHDRSATDQHAGQQQDDLDHDRSATDRHDGQQQDDLDHDRSATDRHDVPDAGGRGASQIQAHSQNRRNKLSARWNDERDIRAGTGRDERISGEWTGTGRNDTMHGEWTGFGNRKRKSLDQNNSGIDDVVVPVKVSHLSTAVAPEKTEKQFDVEKVHGYQKLPFLSDADTVRFIQHSHTMFIMRGLPGSGKSTVVKCLQDLYRGSVAVCSADDFFMDNDGTYNFDASQLTKAHKFCQNKAAYHCNKGTRVVVIDNTNIQRWTMAFYMKLAQNQHHYHVIIVEPQTPWRYDPVELGKRNKHNVDEEIIAKKLQSLRDNVYRPLYYGWFLCKDDSSLLVRTSREVLQQCVNEVAWPDPSGQDDSGTFSVLEDILNNLVISYTDPVPMLHCTAAYLARRSKDPYHTNESVNAAMGRKFCLFISGFVYSKKALSARVSFQGNLDDSTSKGSNFGTDNSVSTASGSVSNDGRINQADLYAINQTDPCTTDQADLFIKDEEEILREKYRDVHVHTPDSAEKHALFQNGCSAHVTISYANDSQSKQSGEDILNILELEFYGKVRQKKTSVGLVSAFGQDLFQIQLKKPFVVNTMFQGFYSSRG